MSGYTGKPYKPSVWVTVYCEPRLCQVLPSCETTSLGHWVLELRLHWVPPSCASLEPAVWAMQYIFGIKPQVPPLQTPGLARGGLPGGGGGRSPSDILPGGGGIARVFEGNLWYPPLMQAKRTRVKRLSRRISHSKHTQDIL